MQETGKEKLVLEQLLKKFGSVAAVDHMDLTIGEGKLYSFLGPSGCGKTTTLRMVAGLETPSGGRIIVDGKVLSDNKQTLPPEKRNMGMVFQSYAVWPHMTVEENVGYGLKIKKVKKPDVKRRVGEMLELVGLEEYASRYPTQLSGGQQQRVALARALVSEPSILLLDEPLSNLDAKLRENMRFEIRSIQQRLGITAIYVTHSQDEALAVSDEIVIMRDGIILQRGAPEEVYNKPNCYFVADFIGLANSFPCALRSVGADSYVVDLEGGQIVTAAKDKRDLKAGDKALVILRPEHIKIHRHDSSNLGDSPNKIKCRVDKVSYTGSIVNYFLDIPGISAACRCQSTPPVSFAENDQVCITFDPEACVMAQD